VVGNVHRQVRMRLAESQHRPAIQTTSILNPQSSVPWT
jgi:hypothetical protein